MIRVLAIGCIAALSAIGAARTIASLDNGAQAATPVLLAEAAISAPTPVARTAQVTKSADGHYWAEAMVDGKAVRFLVDTGATAVALTADDARRLGYNPAGLDYRHEVITAEGRVKAAAVQLRSISIAGARVDNVDALILERGLHTSLLGMSYLGKLQSFEATRTSLILKP
ncbi:MAG: TIGR02281 family clan AA aspartic protease [Caulobacter sp.]|nr:TIGR02281 family clan AA aspartic protease [Caulobacter sp.]